MCRVEDLGSRAESSSWLLLLFRGEMALPLFSFQPVQQVLHGVGFFDRPLPAASKCHLLLECAGNIKVLGERLTFATAVLKLFFQAMDSKFSKN